MEEWSGIILEFGGGEVRDSGLAGRGGRQVHRGVQAQVVSYIGFE